MTTKMVKGKQATSIHFNLNTLITSVGGVVLSIIGGVGIWFLSHLGQSAIDIKTDVTAIKTEIPHIQADVKDLKTTSMTQDQFTIAHNQLTTSIQQVKDEQAKVSRALERKEEPKLPPGNK